MTQHDMQIDNQGFPNFRADLNNAIKALASSASGDTQPSTRYPNQLWADTSNDQLKIRNTANTAWIVLFPLSGLSQLSAADILTLLKTVHGASSGLNADILDGQHGSYYQNADNINDGILAIARLAIASQEEAEAAANSTTLMTPQRVGQAIEELAAPVESTYESSELTMTTGNQTWTLAHGLSSRPNFFQASVVCVIAHAGYSIGNEVMVDAIIGAGDGVLIWLENDTTIKVRKPTILNIKGLADGTFNINTSSSIVKWRLKVRAR